MPVLATRKGKRMINNISEQSDEPGLEAASTLAQVKCITLYQPFASLVALGAKKTETRSWRTHYRGRLLIHAARAFPRWARDLCNREPFARVLREAGYADLVSGSIDPDRLPLGEILAVCNLKHCVRIGTPGIDLPLAEPDRSFGDYTNGRYAWILTDVQPLSPTISAIGSMGLWKPDELVLGSKQLLLHPSLEEEH